MHRMESFHDSFSYSFSRPFTPSNSALMLADVPSALFLRQSAKEDKPGFPRIDSLTSFDNLVMDDTVQVLSFEFPEQGDPCEAQTNTSEGKSAELEPTATEQPQKCSVAERKEKIAKYKAKLKHRRERIPVSRRFEGRSSVARGKNRNNGKFKKSR